MGKGWLRISLAALATLASFIRGTPTQAYLLQAVIGAAIVMQVLPILPYALSFAAGAMIFIVVEEVIPESQRGGNTALATMGLIAGFIVMMVLDVALG